jgi:dTDP-4-amino-4,6-dideoxygalactose transaminase
MPIRVAVEATVDRDTLINLLRAQGIVPRRYFHPLIPEFQYYRSNASADPSRYPVAVQSSKEVLCLPLYPELSDGDVLRICAAIRVALVA